MLQGRSIRANRGTMIPELVRRGLDSDEENVLKELESDDESDASTTSDSSTATPSDFSDEEDNGRLSEASTDDEAERHARCEDNRENTRGYGAAKGAKPSEKIFKLTRLRPPPTIPHSRRMEDALCRAERVKEEQHQAALNGTALTQISFEKSRKRPRHQQTWAADQRVMYSSSLAILERYGTPVVISFSHGLPPVFQARRAP
jgi:hypothetical protein